VVNIYAAPSIRFNAFVRNHAGESGGAIVINDNSQAVLHKNTIAGNTARAAAGVLVLSDNRSQITDNTISHNVASDHGGGLYLVHSNAKVTGNQIIDNQARTIGGGVVVDNQAPIVENNLVSRNRAGDGGAGFYLSNSQPTLRHNTIASNGRNQNGDGVMLVNGAAPSLSYNVIVGNDYGIRSGGGQPRQTMRNSLFDNRLGNYQGLTPGATDLLVDPLFISGSGGGYYLAQNASGQGATSPLVDACAETAQALGLHLTTTRTDGQPDRDLADIGFHFTNLPPKVFIPLVHLSD
jgi:parallel beta-helix repeat protein